jgi:hypothetical protein
MAFIATDRTHRTSHARVMHMRRSLSPSAADSHEPIGIVIADGGLGDHIPRFSAFVWGPFPDEVERPAASRSRSRAPLAVPALAVAP